MKIITRQQLIECPSGTIFSYYEPCIFRGLYIKESEPDEYSVDFVISDLIGAVETDSTEDFIEKCKRMEDGHSMPVDFETSGREGLSDDRQLFAIYENSDVKKLAERLRSAV